ELPPLAAADVLAGLPPQNRPRRGPPPPRRLPPRAPLLHLRRSRRALVLARALLLPRPPRHREPDRRARRARRLLRARRHRRPLQPQALDGLPRSHPRRPRPPLHRPRPLPDDVPPRSALAGAGRSLARGRRRVARRHRPLPRRRGARERRVLPRRRPLGARRVPALGGLDLHPGARLPHPRAVRGRRGRRRGCARGARRAALRLHAEAGRPRPRRRAGRRLALAERLVLVEDVDGGEVPRELSGVEPVADHEEVVYLEAYVVEREAELGPGGGLLVEERDGLDGGRLELL